MNPGSVCGRIDPGKQQRLGEDTMSKHISFDATAKWGRTDALLAMTDLADALFGWLG